MRYCPLCERKYGDEVTVCAIDGSTLRESGTKQDPFIGKIVRARYRVLKKLGEGGMGSVYLAEQITINRNVALKILHPDFARDPEFVRRFRQEAKLAASLSHHNIVTIFDFDQADDGSLYIVMEYVAGNSLSAIIKSGLLDVGTAVRLGIQIAEGLKAAHTAGVIHRDIKPENIMVLPGDEIKLMDFGIARLSNVEGVTRLTRSGMIMGTPTYMSPEQIEGGEVGVATDIYAFGVLLYEMLSGQVPFTAPTPGAVLIKHLTETAPPLRKLRNDVPAWLEKVVKQALEKKPSRRQRSMDEVVELLAKAQRATAADRKSIISTMGGFFKSAFTHAAEPKPPTHESTALQELEHPLDTGFDDTRLSAQQPSILAEPASPIDRSDVRHPVTVAPASAPVDFADVPAPIASPAETETIGLTERQSQIRYKDVDANPAATSNTVIDSASGETLVETTATTATTPVRRGRAATWLYAGLSAAAVVLLTALGFLLYHRQSDEPETTRLAQGTTRSPTSAVRIEPTGENLPAKVESPPRETRRELQIEPELSRTRKNAEVPQHEKKPAAELPATPSPRPSADFKTTNKKAPEVKPTPVKERTEIAKLAPNPETPPTKKVIQEEVKVTAKPKEADADKTKKPEPAKKEPETKVASIDKPAIKQPETPPPLPENRLLSLAIISAKRDINVKERVPLTVRGKYSNGNENEIVTGVRFESSDANVAAVNSRGEIEGKKEGKAEVTARYAGVVSGVYTFNVKGDPEKSKEDQAGERLQDQRRRLLR